MEARDTARDRINWVKSSYSGGSGTECVEVAALGPTTTGARDSKNPEGPVLTFSREAWACFVAAVQRGELG
ncbi:DUF397 domain-containing protein [Streptomyces sp. NPDC002055]|uniref:DUF397 domain-containing protein n=1 Tax=Streptomyces sp. NPDC002055 TaxID=3154534 RepID=UPI00333343AE